MKQGFVFPLDISVSSGECQDGLKGCWEIGSIGDVHILMVDNTYTRYQNVLNAGGALASFITTGHKVVMFVDQMLQKCGKPITEAILLHEIGHHVHNQMTFDESDAEDEIFLSVDESVADDFAIQYIGREVLKDAMVKSIMTLHGYTEKETIELMLDRDRPRFEKLFG